MPSKHNRLTIKRNWYHSPCTDYDGVHLRPNPTVYCRTQSDFAPPYPVLIQSKDSKHLLRIGQSASGIEREGNS